MKSYMEYNGYATLPAAFLFDGKLQQTWHGHPSDSSLITRACYVRPL